MVIYLGCFLITLFFTHVASKNSKNRVLLLGYSIMAILPPAIIAGCRDSSVGTDTEFYGLPCYNMVVQMGELSVIIGASQWEPLYTFLLYLGEQCNGTFYMGLFFVELWSMLFAYVAIYLLRDKLSMTLAMYVYLFLFYNPSLNLMRQSMSISVCLLCWAYLYRQKYVASIILFIVAYLCHRSSLLFALPCVLLYYMVIKKRKVPHSFVIIFILCVCFLKPLASFLISMGVLSQHFVAYIEDETSMFSYTNALFQGVLFLFAEIFSKMVGKKDGFVSYTLLIAFLSALLICTSVISIWAFRIAYFFEILYVVTIPYLLNQLKENRSMIMKISFFIMIAVYWFVDVVINGTNETYPYTSKLLGI